MAPPELDASAELAPFAYALIRVVPRVERGECINVGVVLYSRPRRYLGVRTGFDAQRLLALWPNLDLDAEIDVIETPWEDAVRELVRGRRLLVAVDMDALKKAGVALDGLVTLRRVDVPLRTCLHELLDPVKLTFVVCPDGLLITSAPENPQPRK